MTGGLQPMSLPRRRESMDVQALKAKSMDDQHSCCCETLPTCAGMTWVCPDHHGNAHEIAYHVRSWNLKQRRLLHDLLVVAKAGQAHAGQPVAGVWRQVHAFAQRQGNGGQLRCRSGGPVRRM